MIYQFFPRSQKPPDELLDVYYCFKDKANEISSNTHNAQKSDVVLSKISEDLRNLNFRVETGKKRTDMIVVPVLYGQNGIVEKKFCVDALSADGTIILEVEAGRAVVNYQFLKDIFQASMMPAVDYLVLAVRENYRNKNDFKEVYKFLEILYMSENIKLALKGIFLIGY